MALPPRGHPERPLRLAVRSMWVLGVFLVGLGSCALGGLIMAAAGGGLPMAAAMVGSCYVLPGVAFILCAVFVGRYQEWAAIAGIALASLGAGTGLIGAISTTFVFLMQAQESGATLATPMLIGTLIALLVAAACGQLIYHLAKSFAAIRHHNWMHPPAGRGFTPMMPHTPPPHPPDHPTPPTGSRGEPTSPPPA